MSVKREKCSCFLLDELIPPFVGGDFPLFGERQEVGGQARPGGVCNPGCASRFRVSALHDVVCGWYAPPTS